MELEETLIQRPLESPVFSLEGGREVPALCEEAVGSWWPVLCIVVHMRTP